MSGHTHQKKHTKNTGSTELLYKEEGEEYAIILAEKGSANFEIEIISTSQTIIAKARGALISGPKRQKISKGDYVLIQRDDGTTTCEKYYITHKYSLDHVKQLKKAGHFAKLNIAKTEVDKSEVVVAFESEIVVKAQDEPQVDDSFIADL